jgi:hypothetical protein
MTTRSEFSPRRVVVALDAAADFATTIEMAASVAVAWGARLHALFVEDESLWRLASLPFAQQVNTATALRDTVNEVELGAQLKLLARQVRTDLARIADAHSLAWTLESFRAVIGPNALSLGSDELLVVSTKSRPSANALRLGSPWKRTLDHVHQPLLLVPERPAARGPVAVVYDAATGGPDVLAASLRIARAGKRPLIVLASEDLTQSQQEDLARSLESRAKLLRVPAGSLRDLEEVVTSSRVTLLVMGRNRIARDDASAFEPISASSALLVL